MVTFIQKAHGCIFLYDAIEAQAAQLAISDSPPTGRIGSLHISHDDKMCVRGPILLAEAVVGPDAETIGPFAPSFIVDRVAVW